MESFAETLRMLIEQLGLNRKLCTCRLNQGTKDLELREESKPCGAKACFPCCRLLNMRRRQLLLQSHSACQQAVSSFGIEKPFIDQQI